MDLKECLLFGFFCVVMLAPFSLAEPFEVSSPPSVMGNVDQNAVLPCQISLKTQPHKMEVKWERIGDKHIDNIYHFATVTGQETFGPGYLGKIGLLKEGLGTGNVSLKLKKVQVNDEGTYRCIVKSSDWISQTQTVLQVEAFGKVSIEVLGPEGEGIRLACKSSGWFPEPELQWLTKDPQNPQLESNQDHEQLFSVSSSITVLRDSGEITCSVHPRRDLSKKWESTILLSRDIFPHTSPWFLAFWIIIILAVLAVLAMVVLACFVCKGKLKESQRKYKEQKNQLEDKEERDCEKRDVEEQLIQENVHDIIRQFEEKGEKQKEKANKLSEEKQKAEEEIRKLRSQVEEQKKNTEEENRKLRSQVEEQKKEINELSEQKQKAEEEIRKLRSQVDKEERDCEKRDVEEQLIQGNVKNIVKKWDEKDGKDDSQLQMWKPLATDSYYWRTGFRNLPSHGYSTRHLQNSSATSSIPTTQAATPRQTSMRQNTNNKGFYYQ